MNNNYILGVYEAILRTVKQIATIISGLAMIALIVSFSWLVFGRYVLNDTPTWVEQLSLLLVITISFLTASIGIHERSHLSVDLFTQLLPESGRLVVSVISDIVMATFGFLMAVHVYDLAMFALPKNIPLLGISEAVRYVPVIIAGGMIFVFSIDRIIRDVWAFTHKAPTQEDN